MAQNRSWRPNLFRTQLSVRHVQGKLWTLTEPLVWEGRHELLVVRSDFDTDFASIPKAVRWLMDNAGANSEAAVLHDAVYQESKLVNGRVDPADADGIFRRGLRETGSTALTRGLMWGAVRAKSIKNGRYGSKGPPPAVKLAQLAGIALLAVLVVIPPTAVAFVGLMFYLLANWIVAVVWKSYEQRRFPNDDLPNWPYPKAKPKTPRNPYKPGDLVVLKLDAPPAQALIASIDSSTNRVTADAVTTAALAEADRLSAN